MCGIAGSTRDPDGVAVALMSETLRHRGPDDAGRHTDPRTGTTIGVRRLAIMDVGGGHQPLCNEDASVWVVFNGEIYNHPRLREELIARGHHFQTTCDTEVLVHLYEEYGDSMVHALEGMFAFALWDERQSRLMLARDRFGEKPLFVHESDGELMFASELTALLEAKPSLRELDPAAVDAFFVLGYVPGPGTIVSRVRQLPPGHLLSWDRESRSTNERSWWSPPAGPSLLHESVAGVKAEVQRLFDESLKARMIADVPLGVFLSGGIDSTLVAAGAAQQSSQQLKTFTVGYDVGNFDETPHARRIAATLSTEHHEVTLTQSDVASRAPRLLAQLDQPLADQAVVSLHALSEFARPLVTVALGGEGADELFGGYPRYRWLDRAGRVQAALPGSVARPLEGLLRYGSRWPATALLAQRVTATPVIERHLDWVTAGRRHSRHDLYGPRLTAQNGGRLLIDVEGRSNGHDVESIGRRLMRLDQVDYLPDDVLVKTDRAGMLVSLEIRSVFLHGELAELASSVDTSLHLRGRGKSLLHAMLPSGMETPHAPGRYRKTAFRAPAAEWLRGPLASVLRAQLERGSLYKEGWFDRAAGETLVREHISTRHDHSDRLWPLLALGLWMDRFYGLDAA
jgi:asparagine synthase (glutamine-hydrolysing)